MIDPEKAAAERAERAADRAALVAALARMKLLPAEAADPEAPAASSAVLAAVHAFGARTRSRLFAVRLEDLAGDEDLVNLPGTDREHPNWRRKLEDAIETLFETDRAAGILSAVVAERPR
jgi:4-alpha-glucanotransferase